MLTSDYLRNPVIPDGFYYVRCVDVEARDVAGSDLPEVVAALRIVPFEEYGAAGNQIMHVTLRASPKAIELHEKFGATFGVRGAPEDAKGRFGCVKVLPAEYEGTMYGGVHFIKQSRRARIQVLLIEGEEQRGEIPWGEPAPDTAPT